MSTLQTMYIVEKDHSNATVYIITWHTCDKCIISPILQPSKGVHNVVIYRIGVALQQWPDVFGVKLQNFVLKKRESNPA